MTHFESLEEGEKIFKAKDLVDNLKRSMAFVRDYAESNAIQRKSERGSSAFEIKTYDCNNEKSIDSFEPE